MSDVLIRVSYEGRRERFLLQDRSFAALEDEVKRLFDLEDVDLVAKYKDKSEYDIRDDDEVRQHLNAQLDKILVSEYLKEPLGIVLGHERHSLDLVPISGSVLVRYAKQVVIPEFRLPKFVEQLGDTCKFVRLSYYHLLACGEYMVANDVEELAGVVLKPIMENSKVTFDLFRTTTREMLQLIQLMFQLSREGVDLHDRAVETGRCLGEKAEIVTTESGKMVNQLTVAEDEVTEVTRAVSSKKAEKGEKEMKYDKKLKKTNDELTRLRKVIEKRDIAKQREEEARNRHQELVNEHWRVTWFFHWMVNSESYKLREQGRVDKDKAQNEYDKACKAARLAEEEKTKLETLLQEQANEQEELSKVLRFLTEASKSIKQARLIVDAMQTFWRKMESAGKSLTDDRSFLENTKMAVGDDRMAKRLRHSLGYKRQAINYIARIVAIRDISIDCSKQLTLVGDDIDAVLGDTPTRQQALTRVEEMSRETQGHSYANTIARQYSLEDADQETMNEVAEVFSMPLQVSK